jgi:glycosyltransferase involved in cell wall biosynthesis
MVCTIYGQFVPRWLPRYLPVIVGARTVADMAAPMRPRPPALIEPPVNTDTDAAERVDSAEFRRTHGLGTDIVVGVVSRLDPDSKADGIELAIRAIQLLNDPRIRLVVTGDGPAFGDLSASAERVNSALGRRAVIMIGSLADPRPAYAAADVALGVGGSALRAMAFGKPLIVLGTRNFARLLTSATVQEFLVGGFGGFWEPCFDDFDPRQLAAFIRDLADQPELRSELGEFGKQLVVERFSLRAAAASLEDIYAAAIDQTCPRSRRLWEGARVAVHRTGSEALPVTVKDRLRPMVSPLLHSPGHA